MAMSNSKSIKRALAAFFKENGRQPTFEEGRDLILGRTTKKKAAEVVDESNEQKEKAS
jgi:hypothetical protein